jgi:acetyl-CoA carboxylase carboxyl transferase subunit beta
MPWFRKKKGKIEPVCAIKIASCALRMSLCAAKSAPRIFTRKSWKKPNRSASIAVIHFRLGAYERLEQLFDDAHCEELDSEVVSTDPLGFVDSKPYSKRISQAQSATGLPEAVITARGKVGGHRVFAGAMDMNFIGGSMGSAVGEKITRLIERAINESGAVIIFAASGGARMQEGHAVADADGEISAGPRGLGRTTPALHLGVDRSDYRRSYRELRDAG